MSTKKTVVKKPPPSANSKMKPSAGKNNQQISFEKSPNNNKQITNIKTFAKENINNAIHEFLLKSNYLKTLMTFQEELLKNYSANKSLQMNANEAILFEEQMVEAFESGNRDLFYDKWNSFVPVNIRFEDINCCKLEFYLQIYFLIYPIHPLFKKSQFVDKNTVLKYKKYLETKGSELSKTNEFLPYYALPYIQKPQEHPALKELFTKEWIINLRSKLLEFLTNLFNSQEMPFLYQIFQAFQSNKSSLNMNMSPQSIDNINYETKDKYISQLEANNKELINVIQDFNTKYTQMQKNYKQFAESAKTNLLESQNKWSAVAKELVLISKELISGIEGLKSGIEINENKFAIIVNKTLKYEKFLNTNLEDLISQSQDVSLFDKASTLNDNDKYSEINISPTPQQDNTQYFKDLQIEQVISNKNINQLSSYEALDFNKIRYVFENMENEEIVCAVLQALRWRITRTKNPQRREVIATYSLNDILGCNVENSKIQENLLTKSKQKIKEFSLRLVNALASDYYGRSYLVSNEETVINLIVILKNEKEDSLVRRNTLGSLQKLSLRKKPQIIMIENGLISWIVNTLKNEKESLSEYSIEYTTALFMNLSLRNAGKTKCEDPQEGVLSVLNDLLEHENMQVRTFVNGTLYSLFSRPLIREQAKAIGMLDILKYLLENSDERFTKQIQYIMDQLSSDPPKDKSEILSKSQTLSESNDEDNDVDDFDDDDDLAEEEELEESIHLETSFPLGEDLLTKLFALPLEEGSKQQSFVRSMVKDQQQKNLNTSKFYDKKNQDPNNLFKRPTTPSLVGNNVSNVVDKSRELPSEMKSRPKILRTPMDNNSKEISNISNLSNIDDQTNEMKNPKGYPFNSESPFMNEKKIELRKLAETSEEYKQAFESKNRILRTPPTHF